MRGTCDFHVVRVRGHKYQIGVGRSADGVANFRYQPNLIDDCRQSEAWERLHAALASDDETVVKVELEHLECAEQAMNLPQLVGVAINSWRMATGRTDFPSVAFVAQSVGLPEPMVKVTLRQYERAAG